MRFNKKCRILELIKTIEEGFDYIKHKCTEGYESMLRDCIDALLYILNMIENEESISECINNVIFEINDLLISKHDNKILICSINSIEVNIRMLKNKIVDGVNTELEIAFMPYKTSMWDSLESIWMEAKSDKDCSAYIIPIPYYELNQEGMPSKMCYEGNDFPKEIEVMPYDLYDLENRQPDIVYIHNPYDGINKLTMVYPKYFSKNLLNYTNMLVYVPYFVAGSYENQVSQFNLLPGAVNSTKVIVQSKVQKELFIASGHSCDNILNLGSPKFDATLLACRNNKTIPPEWKNIIKDKKVFLLNTGISDLLSNLDWINNVEQILNSFIDNHDCTLIWRPHPLMEITIKTMRPKMLDWYESIIKKVNESKNIIVDQNSDVYPSIAISNALISDYSSVMFQYMITEKPILSMIKNEILDNSRFYAVDYLENYFLDKGVTVSEFIQMVLNGEDPKKEERMKSLRNSVSNVDGTCGKKIHEKIKDETLKLLLNYL